MTLHNKKQLNQDRAMCFYKCCFLITLAICGKLTGVRCSKFNVEELIRPIKIVQFYTLGPSSLARNGDIIMAGFGRAAHYHDGAFVETLGGVNLTYINENGILWVKHNERKNIIMKRLYSNRENIGAQLVVSTSSAKLFLQGPDAVGPIGRLACNRYDDTLILSVDNINLIGSGWSYNFNTTTLILNVDKTTTMFNILVATKSGSGAQKWSWLQQWDYTFTHDYYWISSDGRRRLLVYPKIRSFTYYVDNKLLLQMQRFIGSENIKFKMYASDGQKILAQVSWQANLKNLTLGCYNVFASSLSRPEPFLQFAFRVPTTDTYFIGNFSQGDEKTTFKFGPIAAVIE